MKLSTKTIRIFFMKLVIFTIPFQSISVIFPQLQLPTFLFFLYLFVYIINPDFRFFNKFIGKQYLTLLALYFLILGISIWNFNVNFKDNGYSILRQMPVYFTLFFFISNEIFYENLNIKSVFHQYVNGIILIAVLFALNISVEIDFNSGRKTIMSLNSNEAAVLNNLAILVIFGLIQNNQLKGLVKWVYMLSIILMINLMISTGSRGGLVGLVIGFFVYYFFDANGFLSRTKNILKGIILVAFIGLVFLSDDLIFERFFHEQENFTESRTTIWENVYHAVGEDLIIGLGVFEYSAAMTRYLGKTKATHNEYLTILVYSGVLGLFLFIKFLLTLFRSSIRANKKLNNPIFLSLFFVIAFTLFKAGGSILELYIWAFLGIISASGLINTSQYPNKKIFDLAKYENQNGIQEKFS